MLILLHDVKCGFEDLYIVEKDLEFDLASVVEGARSCLDEVEEEYLDEYLENNPTTEEQLYNKYKDDIDGLMEYLEESGHLEGMEDADIEYYAHCWFSRICFAKGQKPFLPGIYEIENPRLVYLPEVRSDFYYINGLTSKAACELLNISRQQLHYYVKQGKVRKEYNKEHTKFVYNQEDLYTLKEILDEKDGNLASAYAVSRVSKPHKYN